MWTAVVWNISWFVLQAAYVPYAMRHLGLDAGGVGLTLGCYGAGMLIGATLAARAARSLPFGAAVLLGPLMSVWAAAAMLASWWWPHAAWAALSFVLFGAGPLVWTVTTTTLRQTLVPARVLGQVSAIFLTVNTGARPLGAALGGVIGAHWGEGSLHRAGRGGLRGAGAADHRLAGARVAAAAGAGGVNRLLRWCALRPSLTWCALRLSPHVVRAAPRAATHAAMRHARSAWRSSSYTTIHGAPAASVICTRWISLSSSHSGLRNVTVAGRCTTG